MGLETGVDLGPESGVGVWVTCGNTSVLTSVLVAVGELAQVPGREMAVYADDLLSI